MVKGKIMSYLTELKENYSAQVALENEKSAKAPVEPKKKPIKITYANDFTVGIVSLSLAAVCLITGIILMILFSSAATKAIQSRDFLSDMGEEYKTWEESWEDVKSFDELEDGWSAVEKAWSERGITISWQEIKDLRSGMGILNVTSNYFTNRLREMIDEKFLTPPLDTMAWTSFVTICLAIVFLITIVLGLKRIKAIKTFVKDSKENKINKAFNEIDYPKLVTEYREAIKQHNAYYDAEIKKLIDYAKEQGIIKNVDSETMSYSIWCFCRGFNADAVGRNIPREEAVKRFKYSFGILLDGMKP